MPRELILASTSPFRRMLMRNAGLEFTCESPGVDERQIERRENLNDAEDIAVALAREKALAVGVRNPEALVIGCDQTMSLDGTVFHKPDGLESARRQLLELRGRCHRLNSAIVLTSGSEILWSFVGIANLTMRQFSDEFLESYLERVSSKACQSVGGYQLEAEGVQLFSGIEGDYFTILGLPLIPLLERLRTLGVLHA